MAALHSMWHVPDQESNLCRMRWKHRVLTVRCQGRPTTFSEAHPSKAVTLACASLLHRCQRLDVGESPKCGVAWGRGDSATKAGAPGIFRPIPVDTLAFLCTVGCLCVHPILWIRWRSTHEGQFRWLWPLSEGAASLLWGSWNKKYPSSPHPCRCSPQAASAQETAHCCIYMSQPLGSPCRMKRRNSLVGLW